MRDWLIPNSVAVFIYATMALGKGAYAIHQSGQWYTDENIDRMLMERHLNKKARRGSSKNHIKGRTMSGGHRLCADRSGSGQVKMMNDLHSHLRSLC